MSKPVILEDDGVLGQLPDGGIINAGGTDQPTWTVDGQGVILDDGSSSSGGPGITLQKVYDNTPNLGGAASLVLQDGKDLVIKDPDDGTFVRISGKTGSSPGQKAKVTINGDLEVTGDSTQIDTIVQDSDHWIISPASGATSALVIRPDNGVTPLVDLVSVRKTYVTAPVFRITKDGDVISTENLTVGKALSVDGGDLAWNPAVKSLQLGNATGTGRPYFIGSPGSVYIFGGNDGAGNALQFGYGNPGGAPDGSIRVNTTGAWAFDGSDFGTAGQILTSNGPTAPPTWQTSASSSTVFGYEHVQSVDSTTWTIMHNGNTLRASVTIYDTLYEQIIPERVQVIDANTIVVTFTAAIAGSAMVFLF